MVEFPPYMKLVVNRSARSGPPVRRGHGPGKESGALQAGGSDSVHLVRKENRLAAGWDVPTAREAEAALIKLSRDLPGLDAEEAGELHSGLDRRVILSLLAPLMDA